MFKKIAYFSFFACYSRITAVINRRQNNLHKAKIRSQPIKSYTTETFDTEMEREFCLHSDKL